MSHRCCINGRAASTSGRLAPQTETGIIFRTRPCRVLTERVRNPGGGGGGRAREAGRGGGVFRVLAGGFGWDRGLTRRWADQGVGFDQELGAWDEVLTRVWGLTRRWGLGTRFDQGVGLDQRGSEDARIGEWLRRAPVAGATPRRPCSSGSTIQQLPVPGHPSPNITPSCTVSSTDPRIRALGRQYKPCPPARSISNTVMHSIPSAALASGIFTLFLLDCPGVSCVTILDSRAKAVATR